MAYETRKFNVAFRKALQIIFIPHIDTYFFKINSKIFLPSTPRCRKGLFPV